MGHGVQRAAADASLGHTKHLRQAGDQPVAGQKGAFLLTLVAGRVLAADGAAAFLDALAQLDIGGGVGRIDGRSEERHGRCASFHRRAVALTVETVRQTADNDGSLFGHLQRKVKRRLPPVSAGAAGAHHAHIAVAVQAGGLAGDVQHQRHIRQVPQAIRVGGIIGCDDLHTGQQTVVQPLLIIKGGGVAQLGDGAVAQKVGRCFPPGAQGFV